MKRLGKWSPLSASFIALCSAATAWSESTIAPDNQSKEGKTAVPNALRAVQTNKVIPDIFIAPSTDSSTQSAPPLTSVISKLKLVIEQDDVILSGMHGIEIRVLNNGDRPIVLNGDRAIATIGSAHYLPATLAAIEPKKSPPDDARGKIKSDVWATVTATASVGAVQTIQDQNQQDGPVLGRYGQDEARRRNETSYFGRRIIWPGDASEGVIYFQGAPSLQSASLVLPVNTLYNEDDKAVLTAGEQRRTNGAPLQ